MSDFEKGSRGMPIPPIPYITLTTVGIRMEEGCDDLIPTKAYKDDAAYDLRAKEDYELAPGEIKLVKTGLFLELPREYEAQIRPRSGLALKHGITLTNSPGTIDCNYRGEVGVILQWSLQEAICPKVAPAIEPFKIKRGDRIAQMVITRLPNIRLIKKDTLTTTDRGAGGFGSTGVE